MPKRREHGEGAIYQTKDGRWRGEILLGFTTEGKHKRKIVYGKTRLEVRTKLDPLAKKQRDGVDILGQDQTLAKFLTDWLESTVKPKNRAQTLRSYEWIVRTHLIPGLGKLTLEKLSPQKVQAFVNERHSTGLSAATCKHIAATLRAALSQAQRWQLVQQNVAKLITLPRAKKYEPVVLAPGQVMDLLAATAKHQHAELFSIALSLGLRRGEVLGLRWTDIDLEKGELRLSNALERVKGKGTILGELKSLSARRILRLPQVCLAALLRQQELQRVAREWAGDRWKEAGFIFTTSVGTHLQPEEVTRAFTAAMKKAKLPGFRFHDLRHSCATLLLAQGVHPKLVQETLGHSSFQLTMDLYSHMIPQLRNEVADQMDAIFAIPTKIPTKKVGASVN